MKKILLAVTFLLVFSQCGALDLTRVDFNPLTNYANQLEATKNQSKPLDEHSIFNINSRALLLSSYSLIYTDIFECTKPSVGKSSIIYYDYKIVTYVSSSNTTNQLSLPTKSSNVTWGEANSVAKIFWDYNLWEVGYVVAALGNTVVVNYLDQIDNTGISGYVYMLAVNIAEMNAIYLWRNSAFIPSIKVEAPLVTMMF